MWGHCGLEGGTHVSGILLPSGWRMEHGGRGKGGERGIGCQKAPIANEMEEDDGEGDGEERTNGTAAAWNPRCCLRVRARLGAG